MPFRKINRNLYLSPSGKRFNAAQVKLYYANGGAFPGDRPRRERKKSDPGKTPPKK